MNRKLSSRIGVGMSSSPDSQSFNNEVYALARWLQTKDKAERALVESRNVRKNLAESAKRLKKALQVESLIDQSSFDAETLSELVDFQISDKTKKSLRQSFKAIFNECNSLEQREFELRDFLEMVNIEYKKSLGFVETQLPGMYVDVVVNAIVNKSNAKTLMKKGFDMTEQEGLSAQDVVSNIESEIDKSNLKDVLVKGASGPSLNEAYCRLYFNKSQLNSMRTMIKEVLEKYSQKRGDSELEDSLFTFTGRSGIDVSEFDFIDSIFGETQFYFDSPGLASQKETIYFRLGAWEVSTETFVMDYKDEYEDGFQERLRQLKNDNNCELTI